MGHGDGAALAVTDGLLRNLTGRQVAGVLAHEIAHLRAGDTAIMSLSDAVSRLVQGLSYLGLFTLFLTVPLAARGDPRLLVASLVLAGLPSIVTLLQLGLSRSREYDADLQAVALPGDVEGLASALEVLERLEGRVWERLMVPHGRVPDPLLLRTPRPPSAPVGSGRSRGRLPGRWARTRRSPRVLVVLLPRAPGIQTGAGQRNSNLMLA